MRHRLLALLPLTAALNGCSSAYDLRAVVIGGKVAFVPAETDIWGRPDCIYSISVSALGGPALKAKMTDDARMVANGSYWNKTYEVTSCDNPFPVFYGAKLKGPPFYKNQKSYNVEAKPLREGVVYEVSTSSEGSAYGGGKFVITDERRIVNLPR